MENFCCFGLTATGQVGQEEDESALLVHLGMTGMLWPRPVSEPQLKHTHVVMLLDDGRELRFIDARRFGRMAYLAQGSSSKGIAAVWGGPAGGWTGRVSETDDRTASANEGTVAGSTSVAGSGEYLCGREPVEGEDSSSAVGLTTDGAAGTRPIQGDAGHSAKGDCAARIVNFGLS